MNKKFTKAAALSIAAVTALSAMALPVSADVVLKDNNVTRQKEMSGSAVNAKWELRYTTLEYTALISGSETNISVQFSPAAASTAPVAAPTGLYWDAWNQTKLVSNNTDGQFFTTKNAANASIAELNKVATYNNKVDKHGAADVVVDGYKGALVSTAIQNAGGTDEFALWKECFNNFVKDFNAHEAALTKYKAALLAYDPTTDPTGVKHPDHDTQYKKYNWVDYKGQTYNVSANASATDKVVKKPTDFAGKTTFTLYTYSVQSATSEVAIQAIIDTGTTKASVINDPDYGTGVINFGGSVYTLIGGSSSTTDPGATDTWYPTLDSERSVYSTLSYLGNNGKWYTSKALADKYGLGYSGTSKSSNWSDYSSSTSTIYFDAESGYYTTANGTFRYVVKNKTDGFYSTSFGSYRAADGLYYPTITAAKNASYSFNGTTTYTTVYTTANARYFSVKTGNFYPSYTDAVNASGSSSYVIDLSTYKAPSAEYLDYYPNYIFGSSTGNKGTAYIYSSKKVAGWNSIRNYVSYKSKGSAVSIAMNKETTVPQNIFTAAKSKNVTLQFINSNGSAVVIKGSTITDASDTNVGVSYNAKVIPTSLKNKAKKANKDVVSTAQIKIGDNGAIGATADVTVKLPAKRSGCTVKAYRYTSSGSLKLVDTSKVAKNGEVTITTDNGGYFLLVVCD